MRCNYCHRHDVATPGMDQINAAKKLFKKKKCIVCHTVEGRGGATAPEITYFGDKDPELVDFSHVTGVRTLFNWNYQHLMAPDQSLAAYGDADLQLHARTGARSDAAAAELAARDFPTRIYPRAPRGAGFSGSVTFRRSLARRLALPDDEVGSHPLAGAIGLWIGLHASTSRM